MTDDVIFDDEEKLSFLFQPDTLFSQQYLATFRGKQLEPEKRLMLAVLEDAVGCFQEFLFAGSRKKRILFKEVSDWIRDENSDHVFSFENICAALKLDPEYVREGLLRWQTKKLAECQNIKVVNILSARHEAVVSKLNTGRIIKSVKQPCREKKTAGLGARRTATF